MKTTLTLSSFILSLSCLMLVACNQSPLERNQNPLKNYDSLGNSKVGKDSEVNFNFNDPKVCPKNFATVTVTSSDNKPAQQPLPFKVGEKKTFKIKVTSSATQFSTLALELYQPLNGMSLNPQDDKQLCQMKMSKVDEDATEGTCELSYLPDDIQNDIEAKTVLYYIRTGKHGCDVLSEPNQLALAVSSKGRTTPTRTKPPELTLSAIDINKVYSKSDKIVVAAKITDPNIATSEQVLPPQFEPKELGTCVPVTDKKSNFECTIDLAKATSSKTQGLVRISFNVFAKSVTGDESARKSFTLNVSLDSKSGAKP